MRVYLPSTLPGLAAMLAAGEVAEPVVYAVTPALREWYVDGDGEALEYAALTVAARASLRLIGTSGSAPPRRVVVAADAPDGDVRPAPDVDRAAVRLAAPLPWSVVASAHVDDVAAEDDVRAAVGALAAADAGDDDAAFVVDGVEDHELAWYAAQEVGTLTQG
jgi:hypothetical protein